MIIILILAAVITILGLALGLILFLKDRDRVKALRQLDVTTPTGPEEAPVRPPASLLKNTPQRTKWSRWVPSKWTTDPVVATELVRAGFESQTAPITYAMSRLICLITMPLLVGALVMAFKLKMPILYVSWGLLVGWLMPERYLLNKGKARQTLLRRALPDALDLMVVCIEAGNGLDAAMLRVAKEIAGPHPALARELLLVNRRVAAGLPRAEALRELWTRTQIDEVKALVSSLVQAERLGTSSGKVLRVYAETLRTKRRQAAEQKAATAAIKMLIPMTIMILPALFIVILGPAGMNVVTYFNHP